MQGFEFIAGGQVRPFRYFSQKVLPTVYDDSLSYLELLQKMELYLNEVITAVNANSESTTELQQLYTEFTQTVNGLYDSFTADVNSQLDTFYNYFNNLDVQTEIDNKLDALVADGTMSSLILPIVQAEVGDDIGGVVDAWLVAHPEATTTVQDGAVTTAKLADDAVTIAKLGADVDALLSAKAYRDSYSPLLTAGVAESLLSGDEQQATFDRRVSGGASIGVHEILGNTEVVGNDLVCVNIEGVKSTGKNVLELPDRTISNNGLSVTFDSQGTISYSGTTTTEWAVVRLNSIPAIENTTYTFSMNKTPSQLFNGMYLSLHYLDKDKNLIGTDEVLFATWSTQADVNTRTFTTPNGTKFLRIDTGCRYNGTAANGTICGQLEHGSIATPYEPYTEQIREIPASTYFPDGMRSAGTAHDKLRRDKAITRIGAVDMGDLTWVKYSFSGSYAFRATINGLKPAGSGAVVGNAKCSAYTTLPSDSISFDNPGIAVAGYSNMLYLVDPALSASTEATVKTLLTGVILFYELATPTETAINPPINMDYLTQRGGAEQIIIPTGEQSAAPTFVYVQGYDTDGVADKALSVIAAIEGAKASTNYAIGSYFVHDGKLYKATSAIASGESITPGTNCTQTTVMAEILALA